MNALIYLLIALIAIVVLALGAVFALMNKNKSAPTAKTTDIIKLIDEGKSVSLAELNSYLKSNKRASRENLGKIANYFAKNFKFPPKSGKSMPPQAREYMDFVENFAANLGADAKVISNLNISLKNANPNYLEEIDRFENLGIRQRR